MAKLKVREYKPVQAPSDRTGFSTGFVTSVKQINNLGISVTGIARSTASIHTLHEFQNEYLTDNADKRVKVINKTANDSQRRYLERKRLEKKLLGKKADETAELTAEKSEPDAVDQKAIEDKVAKEKDGPLGGFLKFFKVLGNILRPLVVKLGAFVALDWIAKNPEKVQAIVNFVTGWFKFGAAIAGFGINKIMDGLSMFGDATDPDKSAIERAFAGIKGIGQLFVGLGGLWAASRVFMPWKLIGDYKKFRALFDIFDQDKHEENRQKNQKRQNKRTRESSKKARKRYEKRYGKKAAKNRFKGKIKGRSPWKKFSRNIGKQVKKFKPLNKAKKLTSKLGKMKGLTKFAKIGAGVGAVFSGVSAYQEAIAAGKTNAQAVGLGVGKAAGGMAGAAIATAVLGPFIGPFAPILGSIVGEWVGGWVGEKLGPLVEKGFKTLTSWLKTAREWVKKTINSIVDNFLNFIKPGLDFFFMFVDWIKKGVDMMAKFNDFIMSAAIDGIVNLIMNIVSKAEWIKEKAGMVTGAAKKTWDFISSPFRAEGGPVDQKRDLRANAAAIAQRNRALESLYGIEDFVNQATDFQTWSKEGWSGYAAGGLYEKYKNGYVPKTELSPVHGYQGWGQAGKGMLHKSVARQAQAMLDAAKKDGHPIGINSTYRSYADQVRVKKTEGYLAATPGTSNHGWGLAMDLNYFDAGYRWLWENADKFGFNPLSGWGLSPNTPGKSEAWHWENLKGQGNPGAKTTNVTSSTPQSQVVKAKLKGVEGYLDKSTGEWTKGAWKDEKPIEIKPTTPKITQGDLNKGGDVSKLSLVSKGRAFDRKLQGGSAIVMLQQYVQQGNKSTQEIILTDPIRSPMVYSKC